jgi:hypothetical protein
MTGTSSLSAPFHPAPLPGRPRPPLARAHAMAAEGPGRQGLLDQAAVLHDQARRSAEAGDLAAAAQAILQSLDCERRAGGLGPQVLQLIKPR